MIPKTKSNAPPQPGGAFFERNFNGREIVMGQVSFIRREDTNAIKGIALIFMLIHHFFTFPQWWPENVSYPVIEKVAKFFNQPFAICVPIFAFLTGYFYYSTTLSVGTRCYKYSIRKCTDLWVQYLFTFGLLLIPAVLLGCYEFHVMRFVMECAGLYLPTMKFCWYVVFYWMAIFILPFFARGCDKNPVLSVLASVLIPVGLSKVLEPFAGNAVIGVVYDLSTYLIRFSGVASGFVFAKYRLFEKITDFNKESGKPIRILMHVLLSLIAFLGVGNGEVLGAVAAPMFIFGLVELFHEIKDRKLLMPLAVLGKYSLSIWFLHSIFFNQCEAYTKPILYLPQSPVLVFLWGLGLCLIAAVLIEIPIRFLTKLKNKALDVVC